MGNTIDCFGRDLDLINQNNKLTKENDKHLAKIDNLENTIVTLNKEIQKIRQDLVNSIDYATAINLEKEKQGVKIVELKKIIGQYRAKFNHLQNDFDALSEIEEDQTWEVFTVSEIEGGGKDIETDIE